MLDAFGAVVTISEALAILVGANGREVRFERGPGEQLRGVLIHDLIRAGREEGVTIAGRLLRGDRFTARHVRSAKTTSADVRAAMNQPTGI